MPQLIAGELVSVRCYGGEILSRRVARDRGKTVVVCNETEYRAAQRKGVIQQESDSRDLPCFMMESSGMKKKPKITLSKDAKAATIDRAEFDAVLKKLLNAKRPISKEEISERVKREGRAVSRPSHAGKRSGQQ